MNDRNDKADGLLNEVLAYCDDFMNLAKHMSPDDTKELLDDLGMLFTEYSLMYPGFRLEPVPKENI